MSTYFNISDKIKLESVRLGLLDTYSGAAAAYSLRKLSIAYSGDAITVRRASDNTTQNIGFVNNELDTASLESFCSGTDGFVTTIYDQAGTNNYTQTNAGLQGIIVSSGSVNRLNGKPVILRSANDNGGYISNFDTSVSPSVKGYFYVGSNSGRQGCIFGSESGGGDYGYIALEGNTSTIVNNDSIATNEVINGTGANYSTRDDFYNLTTSQFLLKSDLNFNFTEAKKTLGYRFSNPSSSGMMSFQEEVIFLNTDDQDGKLSNINDFYSIY